MKKICCYLDRECTKNCVAYIADSSLMPEGLKEAGMPEMGCFRLFMEVAQLLSHPFDEEEDWDEDEDEDEDWDEKK